MANGLWRESWAEAPSQWWMRQEFNSLASTFWPWIIQELLPCIEPSQLGVANENQNVYVIIHNTLQNLNKIFMEKWGREEEKKKKACQSQRRLWHLNCWLFLFIIANLQLGLNFQQCKTDWTLKTVIPREVLYSNKVSTAIRKCCLCFCFLLIPQIISKFSSSY